MALFTNVFLDTNILYDGYTLNNSAINGLKTYLNLTRKKAFVSEITIKEICRLYKKHFYEANIKFLDAGRRIKLFDYKNTLDINTDIDIEKFTSSFEKFYRKEISKFCTIVPYKNDYMEECIFRAVNRIKPCSEDKEEFRDTLIWLSFLDILREQDCAFISNNISEFSNNDKDNFNETLLKDLQGISTLPGYFYQLKDFLSSYLDKISPLINLDLVKEMFGKNNEDIENIINWYVANTDLNTIYVNAPIPESCTLKGINFTGHYGYEDFKELYIIDKISDEKYIISFDLKGWLEFSIYVEYLEVDTFTVNLTEQFSFNLAVPINIETDADENHIKSYGQITVMDNHISTLNQVLLKGYIEEEIKKREISGIHSIKKFKKTSKLKKGK